MPLTRRQKIPDLQPQKLETDHRLAATQALSPRPAYRDINMANVPAFSDL